MLTRAPRSGIGLKTTLSEDQLRGRSGKRPKCPVELPEFCFSSEARVNRAPSQLHPSHLCVSYLFPEDY